MLVNSNISNDITAKELLDRYPKLMRMFMDIGLMCMSCPAEAFHTLEDVSRACHLDLNHLLQRLYKVIEDNGASHLKSDGRSGIKKMKRYDLMKGSSHGERLGK